MAAPRTRPAAERGSSLVLVMVFTSFLCMLGISLLFVTDLEFKTSKNTDDAAAALSDCDSGIAEVVYRLNLRPGAVAPPTGSQLSFNNLTNYNAHLDHDQWNRRENHVDDDLDGLVDDPDELQANREWSATILLTPDNPNPGVPWEVSDTLPLVGPPWGSALVEPTIQPRASWRLYSRPLHTDPGLLRVRYRLDVDTPLGDSEADGPEIVFYEPELATNGVEDLNTLSALGGDGNPANDSPYNITWGVVPARGSPVLLVESTARIERGGRRAAERRVTAELAYPTRPVMGKAVCGCGSTTVGGNGNTNSYSSSAGPYGTGPVYDNGDVGSNGNMTLSGSAVISGSAEAGGFINVANPVAGDATAGGAITGTPGGRRWPFYEPPPEPCLCTYYNVQAEVDAAQATNDNLLLPAICRGPNAVIPAGTVCNYPPGTYYYNNLRCPGCIMALPAGGVVKLYVEGEFRFNGTGTLNATGRPEDLQIISSTTGDVWLNGDSSMRATVYAPNAQVQLNGSGTVEGSIVGGQVTMNGTGGVHYDEDLADLWLQPGRFRLLAWREEN